MDAGIRILGPVEPELEAILSPEALAFVADLHRRFEPRRQELLRAREARQAAINAGAALDFLPETREVREATWQVAPAPEDLQDRRVEITGPGDRKMMINALNSGASVFMADLEDASSPTWDNVVEGQMNLRDAVRGTIDFDNPEGKRVPAQQETATLLVRPRGWHLDERHVTGRWRAGLGQLVRFRALLLSQCAGAHRAWHGSLFLSAEDGKSSAKRDSGTMSSTRPRTRSASHAAPSAPPF